jgi:hypothetical protein
MLVAYCVGIQHRITSFFSQNILVNPDTISSDMIFNSVRYDCDSENYEWAKSFHLQAGYEALGMHFMALV